MSLCIDIGMINFGSESTSWFGCWIALRNIYINQKDSKLVWCSLGSINFSLPEKDIIWVWRTNFHTVVWGLLSDLMELSNNSCVHYEQQQYGFQSDLLSQLRVNQIAMMFSGMKKGLKSIDFYQAVASQHSEGTISGACISVTLVIFLVLLLFASVQQFLTPRIRSDLIIDQKHLESPLKVNIDIEFPKYACSMLSLDIENVLKVHKVNIGGDIKKYEIPGDVLYQDQHLSRAEKKTRIQADFTSGKGCRMKGWFAIDRVPGNFHFSCHGYGDIIQEFINEGTYRNAHKMIDMSHVVHQLTFGEIIDSNSYASNSLAHFKSQKQIRQAYLGISYTYFLDIIEENNLDLNRGSYETYRYTARLNEVILASAPMVLFRYETNPMTVIKIYENRQYHELFVDIVGLVGGIFTLATIIDQFVHSSIHFLMEKHRLGKLK